MTNVVDAGVQTLILHVAPRNLHDVLDSFRDLAHQFGCASEFSDLLRQVAVVANF